MANVKESAGLLLYRKRRERWEVLLVHPGGPFWARRDDGAWSIPKGEVAAGEDRLARAKTELREETGLIAQGPFHPLAPVRQTNKWVYAWAAHGEGEPIADASNTCQIEWPPRSGKFQEIPEVDRAEWFDLATARRKLGKGQGGLIDRLEEWLAENDER